MKEITLLNHNNSIQIKFSVAGKRYAFNPVPGGNYNNPRDIAAARAIATKIQLDRLSGHFDPTLGSYRIEEKPTKGGGANPVDLLTLWDSWVSSLDISPETKADHYEMMRRMIVKNSPRVTDTSFLINAKLAPATFNKRLGYLKSCTRWAKLEPNPWEGIKNRKNNPPKIKPFTSEEILKIVEGFDRLARNYSQFARFLILSGCRMGEAIGLQWADVGKDAICISSSLSVDRTGNGYSRKRKETKTGSVRYLNISKPLGTLLEGIERGNDGLVFHSPEGGTIAHQNFRTTWVKVLEAVGVEYRKPHTLRHTNLSMAIEQGIPITGVAYLAGHKDTRMVMTTYGHMINRPNLPDIDI
jgi:integrase